MVHVNCTDSMAGVAVKSATIPPTMGKIINTIYVCRYDYLQVKTIDCVLYGPVPFILIPAILILYVTNGCSPDKIWLLWSLLLMFISPLSPLSLL